MQLDHAANDTAVGRAGVISTPGSRVQLLVIPTDEELSIAEQTLQVCVYICACMCVCVCVCVCQESTGGTGVCFWAEAGGWRAGADPAGTALPHGEHAVSAPLGGWAQEDDEHKGESDRRCVFKRFLYNTGSEWVDAWWWIARGAGQWLCYCVPCTRSRLIKARR